MDKQKVRIEDINQIPDYEPIFRESKNSKNQEFKVLKSIFYKRYIAIILSGILNIIKMLPLFVIPIATSNIIDAVTNNQENISKTLIIYGVILAVCILENVPMHILYAKVTDRIVRHTSEGFRATVLRKLQRLSITYYKEMESGKLQSKFLRDIDNVEMYISTILKGVYTCLITITIYVVITIYKSPIVLLFYIVVIPVMLSIRTIFKKPMRKTNRAFRKQAEETSSKLTKMLDMLEVTKSHGLEETEIDSVQKDINKLMKDGLNIDKTTACFGSLTWVVTQLFSVLCLFFASIMALKGVKGFTIGSIVLYQSMFSSISNNIQSLINYLPQLTTGKEALHSISEIMNNDDIEDNFNKKVIPKINGEFVFDKVYYKYPNSQDYVIKDFSLNVKKGECIAFVGSSGSGKSTIMNMIIGFLKPVSGRLSIDNIPIENINLQEYRHSLSVVPQNSILFEGNIKENVTYGLEKYSKEDLEMALKMANVLEFAEKLPQGLDTNVGEHGGKLSGGQKQRICIARAIIRKPSVLIMDEATSALDNVSEFYVQQAINHLIKGRTTFIVAHRLSTIRNADRIVVMEKGEIVEVGTFTELMEKKGKFYELKTLNDSTSKIDQPL